MSSSFFSGITQAPPIEVFFMNKRFLDDPSAQKVNLTIGAYRTEEGKPWVLPVVRQAEQLLAADASLNFEYLPVLGYDAYCEAATKFVLGADSPAIADGRAIGVQCLSGTGSLRAGAELLCRIMGLTNVYISKPTWGNHRLVFTRAGFPNVQEYGYWDAEKREINFEALLEDLGKAPEKSAVVLHGCAHNPTGIDPTHEQWEKICEVVKARNLFTFFDIAYQGFASGDPDADAWPIRYWVKQGLEMLVAQSFAKNFGLYNERVGNLTIVVNDAATLTPLRSQMSLIIRANWSNPPAHGCRIVQKVLSTPELRKQWFDAIVTMSSRIKEMRQLLRAKLEELGTPGKWAHITQQIGMFSYTGLNRAQVDHMVEKHKVYLLTDGRINVCGLNKGNVEYVAKAIDDTVRSVA